MKDKVANSFKRLTANFEFSRCLKQEVNDMKFHRHVNLRNVQFVLFILCIIDNRLKTLKQQNTQIVPYIFTLQHHTLPPLGSHTKAIPHKTKLVTYVVRLCGVKESNG